MVSLIIYIYKKMSEEWQLFSFLVFTFCLLTMIVKADIHRYDNGFEGKFHRTNKGRLYQTIIVFNRQMSLQECAYECVKFLNCKSINYNDEFDLCELCDNVYDTYEADENPNESWYNYATPSKQDGGFTQWSKWSNCPQTPSCDGTYQERYRTCTNPRPDYGGANCHGSSYESRKCNPLTPCWMKQNNQPICYSKERPKGFFKVKENGVIDKVRFVHRKGSIRCYAAKTSLDAFWGCYNNGDIKKCDRNRCFSTYIFDENTGDILAPYKTGINHYFNYNLPPYSNPHVKEIEMDVSGYEHTMTRGKEYYVTIGRFHLFLNVFDGDGKHCVDVFFRYTSL